MKMKLKIMTWNISGSAALTGNNKCEIKEEVVDKIMNEEAEIIALTEFVVAPGIDYLLNRLEEEGYIWFQQNVTAKNGILIGMKRDLINDRKFMDEVYKNNLVSAVIDDCNILKVKLPLKKGNKNLYIIGCRMEVELKLNGKKSYDERRVSFDNVLIPQIPEENKEEFCIVCGDFNNAWCHGNLNEKFNRKDYEGRDQINYNLNIIKDEFNQRGFIMADCTKNGKGIQTWENIPEDHIFIRGRGFSVSECKAVKVDGLSEHDILVAKCNLEY